MGRVLYGVLGDAGGHLTRSLAIARQLSDHEVVFVGGGRVASLAAHGFDVVPTPMVGTVVSNHGVDLNGTIAGGMRAVARQPRVTDKLVDVIRDFDPDLILSDYEYFLPRAARKAGRPCISVDRQHFLTHCAYRRPPVNAGSRALTLSAIRTLHGAASRFFVVSFTQAEPVDPALAEVFPPVLRAEVGSHIASDAGHGLVYLYAAPLSWIRRVFGGRDRRFIVYGKNRSAEEGNLIFRENDSSAFLADLASATYVVSHGGHNLISESLHYNKPLLSFPISLKYEQWVNGHLLADAGFGAVASRRRGRAALEDFEANLGHTVGRLSGYRPWSSNSVAARLDGLLKGAAPTTPTPISPTLGPLESPVQKLAS